MDITNKLQEIPFLCELYKHTTSATPEINNCIYTMSQKTGPVIACVKVTSFNLDTSISSTGLPPCQ